ncbi:prepilin-type N-terminal cleavage/methylation domain-containing protein [Nitratiruptor sp. YY09-18]|uniref:prepilin-type N-terminal cleavage/methylation domain-containing protein n=1 Tax=Nitratiruptor sp. YY09-18 TaxID=2724901 RepID=UPI00193823B0|nr:prepilin-type N-terminal cleavage/methylation domain-containing protein [Nitratiruptor sp. YY09-18]BCD68666.1 general secretion pathway protein G [Nitratiruptor sp. YY09-18]
MRKGFTLIELIFVMVVIGVLAAIALPKFKQLKQNAELTNLISAYTTVVQNAPASFFNETELNNIRPQDLNMTDLLQVQAYQTNTGKGWWKSSDNDTVRYYVDPYDYIQFYYNDSQYSPQIRIFTYIHGSKKADMQSKLANKLGLVFANDRNTTTLDLADQ